MTTQNQDVLNQFIIDVKLIQPIQKIVNGLNGTEYRDCDIKWLDAKLEAFVKLACDTLGISGILQNQLPHTSFTILNDHNKQYYLSKFNTILEYFKTI